MRCQKYVLVVASFAIADFVPLSARALLVSSGDADVSFLAMGPVGTTIHGHAQSIDAKATGDFSPHGVTRPLNFTYRANRKGDDYQVQALSEIDIRDFKVEVPCYLGVCVKPNIKPELSFRLQESK